jgi:hypothetical protein
MYTASFVGFPLLQVIVRESYRGYGGVDEVHFWGPVGTPCIGIDAWGDFGDAGITDTDRVM